MATVTQPSANPTNKLTAATIVAAVMPLSGLIVKNLWPAWYDDAVWVGMTPVMVLLVGYLVKDAPNQ